jgi:hypothetical protein
VRRSRLAFAGGVVLAAYHFVVRPRTDSWGATEEELEMRLPGDELIEDATGQTTRAITIHAHPDEIWSWLIQIGADRGGFYSYDWLENHFGFFFGGHASLGIHSANAIIPEWQERTVGDLVCANATGTGGWYVMHADPGRALVLQMADVEHGRAAKRDEGPAFWEFTWAFVLHEQNDGTTRLIVRERIALGKPIVKILFISVGLISFVMTQKMMRGIKTRAERSGRARVEAIAA